MAQYKIKTANTKEELISLLGESWTIISVKGEAFELLSDKIYQIANKQAKKGKRTAGSIIATGVGIVGTITIFAPVAIPLAIGGVASLANSRLRIPLDMFLEDKELRSLANYNVTKIQDDEENKEIILCHRRYKKRTDTFINE
jgi:hypothetical protein